MMNIRDNRHLSEEEADAEIERTQQKITLALQQIDENFATCNQIVTSKIGPGIDQYGESSHQVWDFSKTWLYFFNAMNTETSTYSVQDDESEFSTNRPAFDESSVGSTYRMNHNITANDITNLTGRQGLIRNRLRQPSSTIETATEDNPLRQGYTPNRTNISISTGSSASQRNALSPPQTIPFELPTSSLIGTPIREQAKVLTEHTLRQVGIHSSESESSDSKRVKHQSKDKESYGRAWGESNMDKDDAESRAKFNEFLSSRMVQGEESPLIKSPNNRLHKQRETILADTPTTEHIPANIRQTSTPMDIEMEESISAIAPSPSHSFHINSSYTPMRDQQDDIGAFEFSDTLPHNTTNQRNSFLGTPSSTRTGGTDMTMMQGQYTSMVPAHFDLHYFPEKFRVPPGSVMLTRVYNEFNDRPGTMLTVKDIIQHINDDQTYTEDYVSILISLLSRKKYLKKVGNHDAWVIRR